MNLAKTRIVGSLSNVQCERENGILSLPH